ncbi:MAG TPA: branched-chain amino acid ABC transporter permease [Rhodocyclaceae bacterium]|nr:branched-chain amino acid ABC transporter permease [Rhodocyclaceae bacterium]
MTQTPPVLSTFASQVDLGPLRAKARWKPAEIVFWLLPIAAYFLFPQNLVLLSQIAITALFALSLDLILGYAGIVSLGHAAFFGVGAYAAGLLAQHGYGDPLVGLAVAALIAAFVGLLSSFLLLRGSDLTRLMVTVGVTMVLFEAANKMTDITGGVDGLQGVEMTPLLGLWRFDLYGKVAYLYALVVLFVLFWFARRLVHSPFGESLSGIRQNVLRMPAIGVPVKSRLVVIYTLGAAYAGVAGALLTQTTQFATIEVLGFSRSAEVMLILVLGGTGSLYGALLGAMVFMVAHHLLSDINPTYWQFWLGALLLLIVLFARDGVMGGVRALGRLFSRPRTRTPTGH